MALYTGGFHRGNLLTFQVISSGNMEQYRLNSPTMAVEHGGTNGRMQFVTIPAGALLQITAEPQQSGLVDVRFEGRIVAMFLRDIEERGERVLARAT